MNFISNIWNHPKTSAAGLLIAIVTVTGVLSEQGITMGAAGKGSVITLVGALASALLGLLAQDPVSGPAGEQSKLGAWALIALLMPLPFMSGCSEISVAQDIVNWTPALQSAVATLESTGAVLAPGDGPVFVAATAGFDAAANLLTEQARAYLAHPSASTLEQMQSQIVVLQQQVNVAMLQSARIVNPASQQHVLVAIQAVGTVVSAILSLVQSVSSKAAVAQMAAGSTIKISAVRGYMNDSAAAEIVAAHYGEPVAVALVQVGRAEDHSIRAGF
jgi:hypothetical protein